MVLNLEVISFQEKVRIFGCLTLSKELWRNTKGLLFGYFLHYLTIDARSDFEHWCASTTLVENDSELSEIISKIIRSKIMPQNGIFTYCIGRAKNVEMLKMA